MTMQHGYKRCEFILSKGWADGYYVFLDKDILTNPHHFLYKKTLKQLELESKKLELQGYVDELMDEVEDAIEEAVEDDNISLKRLREIRDTLRKVTDKQEQGLNL